MELKNIIQVENLKFKFKHFGDIFDVAPSFLKLKSVRDLK